MSFWGSLGKIALQAAPYVAAPFTAGASLYAIPATQKLGAKWSEHDNAERAKKGLAPSNFDKWLNRGSTVASFASGTGALGKFGSAAYSGANAANNASKLTGFQKGLKAVGQTASLASGGSPYAGAANYASGGGQGGGGWQGQLSGLLDSGVLNQFAGGGGGSNPSSSQNGVPTGSNMATPRTDYSGSSMAQALAAGRNEATRNQPFRSGYDVVSPPIKEGDPDIHTPMPPIYPQYQPPPTQNTGPWAPSGFQQNLSQASATPRTARRRNPEPVAE